MKVIFEAHAEINRFPDFTILKYRGAGTYASLISGSFKYGVKAKLIELSKVDSVVVESLVVSTTGSIVGKGGRGGIWGM